MEIKVNVEIGFREDLREWIDGLIGGRRVEQQPTMMPTVEKPAEEPAEATQSAAKEEPAEPAQEYVPPTDEELRKLMDITITRIAGKGWGDSADPKVKSLRKSCTRAFKEIAAHLGADRPTAVAPEKRQEFVKRIEEIYVNESTNEVEWLPF